MNKRYKITITKDAANDIQRIINYYTDIKKELSKKFAVEVRKKLDHLEKFPYASSIIFEHRILIPLKRFPYSISISVLEDSKDVIIWAVIHQSQDNQEVLS